jgi:PQQ enzyme repeat
VILHSTRLLRLFLLLLGLSACSSGGVNSPIGKGPVIPAPDFSPAISPRNGEASWMARDTRTQNLLYVSNREDGSVFVYSYPQGKLNGSLFDVRASGLCSDGNGNVFIPQGNEIREYAHGGTEPIVTLRNPLAGTVQFCAVDPATGDLAVSGGSSRAHGLVVYTNARGNPRTYRSLSGDTFRSLTYDNQGNLFVVGIPGSSNRAAGLIELPKGGSRVGSVGWNGMHPLHLGAIQWDGRYLAVETEESGSRSVTISRYRINGGQATSVGQIALAGARSPVQFSIHGGQVIVPNPSVSGSGGAITLYGYPGDNAPRQTIEDARQPQAAVVSSARAVKIAVTTYHYDNMRTGWDHKESLLTYANVNSSSFGLRQTVTLDDQVDTQPLLVPDETTTTGVEPGKHDVVYVATENNTVYAIDASSGTVLFQQNLGSPIPTPLGCNNNGPNVGIDGTPVIDRNANVMYVIAYTLQPSNVPVYYIHELSLANLTDVVPPVLISASHTLANGSVFTFNATYQRQRPALLEVNGNIYAGFGSFCDFAGSMSRGWLLGWQAGSLTPLGANQLNDTQFTSPNDFFLSSIWMAGYGVAADPAGNVYFVTGNSDPSGKSYNSVTNISETAAKFSPDLTQLLSFFTPRDVGKLDRGDVDFGSGGMLLLPQKGSEPPLAAAAGKAGTLFLMNRNNMGGYSRHGNHVVDSVNVGGCWCGPSYFDAASDSLPRIVASGGNSLTVWKVPTSRPIKLAEAGSSYPLPGGQDPGFFTAISSNGAHPGAIIWALARPEYVPGSITLFAFESEPSSSGYTLQQLYEAPAGIWDSTGGDANLVPVVANGKVYVASYEQLDIFGLLGSTAKAVTPAAPVIKAPRATVSAAHEFTGVLVAISGSELTLRTRTGNLTRVDDSDAVRRQRSVELIVGEALGATGSRDAAGILHAKVIVRAKRSPTTWPPDR